MFPRASFLLFACAGTVVSAADTWVQRGTNGFGDANNKGIEWMQVFNGKVYAATGQDNTGIGNPVSIYQSSDLVNWTRVLGPLAGQTDAFFGVANASAIFIGTRSTTPPGQIWRSTDGTTWSQFNVAGNAGFAAAGNIIVAALGLFGTDLYAGFNNPNGGQVWRRAVDGSNNWTKVLDFSNGTGVGAGGVLPNCSPTYLYAARGTLYLSTFGSNVTQNAFLFQTTNGTTWTRNEVVGNGFGDPNNLNIASLVEFGDYLYAGVHNTTTGGQVWRTPLSTASATTTGPWQKVVGNGSTLGDGFGAGANNPSDLEVHHVDAGLGYLWATNINVGAQGSQVWRSADGVTWTQSNLNGFVGSTTAQRGFPTVEFFNNTVVWGGSSIFGAQVWTLATSGIDNTGAIAPAITTPPVNQTVSAGGTATFSVVASGTAPLAYQWFKNGTAIAGATTATLALSNVQTTDAGTYGVTVANSAGTVTSGNVTLTVNVAPPPPVGPTAWLANLSVRTALAANQTLIVGFVVSGGARDILVRAAGPALANFGLATAMADPRLELFNDRSVLVFANDDWPALLAPTFTRAGAFSFAVGSKDAAFVQSLNGAYSVQARGTAGGVVLVEAYDTGTTNAPRLINVSARNRVGTGDDILIAGFSIAGAGDKQLLIRAVGPKLASFGVTGVLADPKLELFNSAAAKIGENDNWEATAAATFTAVGAFPLDANSKDAALLARLAPGTYTVQIKGADGGVGEALVEIYEVP